MKFLNSYSKKIALIFLILSIISIILTVLVLDLKNHILDFQIDGGTTSTELIGTKIKINFSRPLKADTNIQDILSIQPIKKFNGKIFGNSINLNILEDLEPLTSYKILISQDLKDKYGNNLGTSQTLEFKTKDISFAYIKHDSGLDKIIKSGIMDNSEKELYSAKEIKFFKINDKYLVVVHKVLRTDQISVINLIDNSKYEINLDKQEISEIDLTNDNLLYYHSQSVKVEANYVYPIKDNGITQFNLDNKNNSIFNPKDTNLDQVIDFVFSKDDSSIIYKTSDTYYYIYALNSKDKPVITSRYVSTAGFNFKNNKVAFISYDPLQTGIAVPFITIFNSDRTQEKIDNGDSETLDPQFLNQSDNIIFSSKIQNLEGTRGLFELRIYNNQSKKVEQFASINNMSLELPKTNKTDKYAGAEGYKIVDLMDLSNQRIFFDQTKPTNAIIYIFEISNKKLVRTIQNSIELQWIN